MQLPESLLNSLTGLPGFHRENFIKVHETPNPVTCIRTNPAKKTWHPFLDSSTAIPWCENGYCLASRPSFTFDPLFHAGCYYVQEASSMFLEAALKQSVDLSLPIKILDLCAAPGGKSTHIQSLISKDSLLVSNEIIRSRANVLKDNIIKWGGDNVIVTNNDAPAFSNLEGYFDVIVIDAPCSGSGLFRRDPNALDEWSENNVLQCAQRQQKILEDCWPALKEGGVLIYSTCSFSKEEDENICQWITENFEVENLRVKIQPDWGVVESGGGYRFWPYDVSGEGFFMAVYRKTAIADEIDAGRKSRMSQTSKSESAIAASWLMETGFKFVKHENTVYAWPQQHSGEIDFLVSQLKVIYSGIRVGDLIRDKLIPDHALAMNKSANENIRKMELNHESAIAYLQRKDIGPGSELPGWAMATYEGFPLGWIKILSNRVNNYYPKELRILKENSGR